MKGWQGPSCQQSLAPGPGCLLQRMRPSPPVPPPERPGHAGDRPRGCQRVKGMALLRALFLGGPIHPFPPPCPDLGPWPEACVGVTGTHRACSHPSSMESPKICRLDTDPPGHKEETYFAEHPPAGCWTHCIPPPFTGEEPAPPQAAPPSMVKGETKRRPRPGCIAPGGLKALRPQRRARGWGRGGRRK